MVDIKNKTTTTNEKWSMLATVANLYYNAGLTQSQIAERFYSSRSKISRMLAEARELGVVEIIIREPWDRNLQCEEALKKRFSLNDIRVICTKAIDEDEGLEKIAEAAFCYLDSILKERMIVGISWGYTLYRIVEQANVNSRKNIPITVVPIMGAASVLNPEKDTFDLAKDLASAYGGEHRYIYAPLFVKSKQLKESLMQEKNIKSILDVSRASDVILTSVGSIESKSWNNYLSKEMVEILETKGAVGHIGGHFYNIRGREVKTSLVERVVGLSLEEIKECPTVVCVACGKGKTEPVIGALNGQFIDTLIIDEQCAREIIQAEEAT